MSVLNPEDFSDFEDAFAERQKATVRAGLNLRFFIDPIQNKGRSEKEGRPMYDNIEFVEINVPGSRDTHVKKVDASVIERFGPQYEKWKKTQEQPTDGTPLTMVPFLNPAQIKEFAAININTLEQLAELSDATVQKIGMGGADLRKKAQTYMSAGKDTAEVLGQREEIKRLQLDNQQLKQQIAAVNQRYEALLNGGAPPPPSAPQPTDMAAMIRAEIQRMAKEGQI